jgi:D-proline reductase (dithiol) PrdB
MAVRGRRSFETMTRYRGFAQVEYEYVRERVYAPFEWRTFDTPSPRRRLELPLAQARVALVATAGTHLPDQPRFDLGRSGDSSYREIPTNSDELRFSHVGYDTSRAHEDPDVVFPLSLLRRLAAEGEVGEPAARAFSFMGYIPEPEPLLRKTGPEVAAKLVADAVDLVLLVPS